MKKRWSHRAKRDRKKPMEWPTAQGHVVWIPQKRGRGRIVVRDESR